MDARFLLLPLVFAACSPPDEGQYDPTASCCAVCEAGKPCGDACISDTDSCKEGRGCACNADGSRPPACNNVCTGSQTGEIDYPETAQDDVNCNCCPGTTPSAFCVYGDYYYECTWSCE